MKGALVVRYLCATALLLWSARASAQELPPLTPLDAPPRVSSMVLRVDAAPNALVGVPVESLFPFV